MIKRMIKKLIHGRVGTMPGKLYEIIDLWHDYDNANIGDIFINFYPKRNKLIIYSCNSISYGSIDRLKYKIKEHCSMTLKIKVVKCLYQLS